MILILNLGRKEKETERQRRKEKERGEERRITEQRMERAENKRPEKLCTALLDYHFSLSKIQQSYFIYRHFGSYPITMKSHLTVAD